ncbi:MAG: hydrogenase maturation protease, partial [Gaiellaceae bacterium]
GGGERMILVAAVGNLWLGDDGFACEVAKRLSGCALPDDVAVADFGSGGLDLAYEIMRGYEALVLVDVSRQGGRPGTLYVMEVDPDSVDGEIEDGMQINPHGMDPETVLRFVKATGGWPGRVVVVACEPELVDEVAIGLSAPVEAAVYGAVQLVVETVEELRCTSFR